MIFSKSPGQNFTFWPEKKVATLLKPPGYRNTNTAPAQDAAARWSFFFFLFLNFRALPRSSYPQCQQTCQDWPGIFHRPRVSVTTFSCAQIWRCLDTVFTLISFPENHPHPSPPHLSRTCVNLPHLISGRSLKRHLKAAGKQTRGESFHMRWAGAPRWFPFSLCVKFFRVVCSLVIALCWQDGRGWGWERHIINQECFYNKAQTLSNPTHSHTAVSD